MRKHLLPVIHFENEDQVFRNIDTCLSCGVGQVFLINHISNFASLYECAVKVKIFYDLWLGMNFLDLPTDVALSKDDHLFDALWCDASISVEKTKECRKFTGQYFGGLAFKYQPQPKDLKQSCLDAIESIDVPTTSGSGTGKAANLERIIEIKSYLGERPLALASGVSEENIVSYRPYVDYFLVASSITDKGEFINKDRLMKLKDLCFD